MTVPFAGPDPRIVDNDTWDALGPAFSGHVSPTAPNPYMNPSRPDQPPFASIANPAHMSDQAWQTSFYDPTSPAPVSGFVKRPAGPVNLATGKLTGQGFPGTHRWKQV